MPISTDDTNKGRSGGSKVRIDRHPRFASIFFRQNAIATTRLGTRAANFGFYDESRLASTLSS